MIIVSSCSCLWQIHWSHQVLSWEWRCSWGSADRRCSNYIWVINNFIAHWGAAYIKGLTVFRMHLLIHSKGVMVDQSLTRLDFEHVKAIVRKLNMISDAMIYTYAYTYIYKLIWHSHDLRFCCNFNTLVDEKMLNAITMFQPFATKSVLHLINYAFSHVYNIVLPISAKKLIIISPKNFQSLPNYLPATAKLKFRHKKDVQYSNLILFFVARYQLIWYRVTTGT